MDTSQIALNQGLTFLAWATGVIFIVIGAFLVKLIIDLSSLAKNMDDTTTLVKTEIEPALKELNTTLQAINSVVKSTDKQVDKFKGALENLLGMSTVAVTKAKVISGGLAKGLLKGFSTMVNLFSKIKK